MSAQHHDTDVLIIGSGLAGMRAASAVLHRNLKAILVTAGGVGLECASITPMAVNHLATDWLDVPMSAGDREKLVADILAAGLGHAHEAVAKALAKNAFDEYQNLQKLGVSFQTSMGVLVRQHGCFASRTRTLVMEQLRDLRTTFFKVIRVPGLGLIDHVMITRLFVENGRCVGAAGVDEQGQRVTIRAKAVILAAGGGAGVYARSLVPSSLVGSSYVLGSEAGAQVKNLHFVEFVIAVPELMPRVQKFKFMGTLRLRDSQDRDILEGLYPSLSELEKASEKRSEHYAFTMHDGSGQFDIAVARAAERGGCVHVSHTGKVAMTVFARTFNGGVVIDENAATSIPGLYACGESATGAHGALRVGGTYLMEALVFGRIAGKNAGDFAKNNPLPDGTVQAEDKLDPAGGLQAGELENYQKMVRDVMSAKAQVIRVPDELKAALQVVTTALGVVTAKGCREPAQLKLWHQTRAMAACAKLVVEHAIAMPQTCGPHYVAAP